MIVYFTKQYQAVPALIQLYRGTGGVFVSTRRSTVKAIQKVYPDVPVIELNERWRRFSTGERILQQASLIVTGSPNRKLLHRYSAKKCMVFHGTYALIGQEEIEDLRHFDIICAIGPRMEQALQGTGLESKVVVSGYLPFLEFPPRYAEREKLLKQLGLDPRNKTLLYLPMGRPFSSWDVMAEQLLEQLPNTYNLILRPHPSQSVTARIRDRFGFLHLRRMSDKRGNARLDLTDNKLSTLLSIADLVISDGASSPEEAMFYDLPLVFVESTGYSPQVIARLAQDKNLNNDYLQKLLNIYGCGSSILPQTTNISEVIDTALADPVTFETQRKAYFHWVFGEKNTERQQQLIRRLIAVASPR